MGMAVLEFELRLPCYHMDVFQCNLMPLWKTGKQGSRMHSVMIMDFEHERKLFITVCENYDFDVSEPASCQM